MQLQVAQGMAVAALCAVTSAAAQTMGNASQALSVTVGETVGAHKSPFLPYQKLIDADAAVRAYKRSTRGPHADSDDDDDVIGSTKHCSTRAIPGACRPAPHRCAVFAPSEYLHTSHNDTVNLSSTAGSAVKLNSSGAADSKPRVTPHGLALSHVHGFGSNALAPAAAPPPSMMAILQPAALKKSNHHTELLYFVGRTPVIIDLDSYPSVNAPIAAILGSGAGGAESGAAAGKHSIGRGGGSSGIDPIFSSFSPLATPGSAARRDKASLPSSGIKASPPAVPSASTPAGSATASFENPMLKAGFRSGAAASVSGSSAGATPTGASAGQQPLKAPFGSFYSSFSGDRSNALVNLSSMASSQSFRGGANGSKAGPVGRQQRIYTHHDADVTAVAAHPFLPIAASAQVPGAIPSTASPQASGSAASSVIRLWHIRHLVDLSAPLIVPGELGTAVSAIEFSADGRYLIALTCCCASSPSTGARATGTGRGIPAPAPVPIQTVVVWDLQLLDLPMASSPAVSARVAAQQQVQAAPKPVLVLSGSRLATAPSESQPANVLRFAPCALAVDPAVSTAASTSPEKQKQKAQKKKHKHRWQEMEEEEAKRATAAAAVGESHPRSPAGVGSPAVERGVATIHHVQLPPPPHFQLVDGNVLLSIVLQHQTADDDTSALSAVVTDIELTQQNEALVAAAGDNGTVSCSTTFACGIHGQIFTAAGAADGSITVLHHTSNEVAARVAFSPSPAVTALHALPCVQKIGVPRVPDVFIAAAFEDGSVSILHCSALAPEPSAPASQQSMVAVAVVDSFDVSTPSQRGFVSAITGSISVHRQKSELHGRDVYGRASCTLALTTSDGQLLRCVRSYARDGDDAEFAVMEQDGSDPSTSVDVLECRSSASSAVTVVAAHPYLPVYAAARADGTVELRDSQWNLKLGEALISSSQSISNAGARGGNAAATAAAANITCMDFSPDGCTLAVGTASSCEHARAGFAMLVLNVPAVYLAALASLPHSKFTSEVQRYTLASSSVFNSSGVGSASTNNAQSPALPVLSQSAFFPSSNKPDRITCVRFAPAGTEPGGATSLPGRALATSSLTAGISISAAGAVVAAFAPGIDGHVAPKGGSSVVGTADASPAASKAAPASSPGPISSPEKAAPVQLLTLAVACSEGFCDIFVVDSVAAASAAAAAAGITPVVAQQPAPATSSPLRRGSSASVLRAAAGSKSGSSADVALLNIVRKRKSMRVTRRDALVLVKAVGQADAAALLRIGITALDWDTQGRYMQIATTAYELVHFEASSGVLLKAADTLRDVSWASHSCQVGWPVTGIWHASASSGAAAASVQSKVRSKASSSLGRFDDVACVTANNTGADVIASAGTDGVVRLYPYPASAHTPGVPNLGPAHPRSFVSHTRPLASLAFTAHDEKLLSAAPLDACRLSVWSYEWDAHPPTASPISPSTIVLQPTSAADLADPIRHMLQQYHAFAAANQARSVPVHSFETVHDVIAASASPSTAHGPSSSPYASASPPSSQHLSSGPIGASSASLSSGANPMFKGRGQGRKSTGGKSISAASAHDVEDETLQQQQPSRKSAPSSKPGAAAELRRSISSTSATSTVVDGGVILGEAAQSHAGDAAAGGRIQHRSNTAATVITVIPSAEAQQLFSGHGVAATGTTNSQSGLSGKSGRSGRGEAAFVSAQGSSAAERYNRSDDEAEHDGHDDNESVFSAGSGASSQAQSRRGSPPESSGMNNNARRATAAGQRVKVSPQLNQRKSGYASSSKIPRPGRLDLLRSSPEPSSSQSGSGGDNEGRDAVSAYDEDGDDFDPSESAATQHVQRLERKLLESAAAVKAESREQNAADARKHALGSFASKAVSRTMSIRSSNRDGKDQHRHTRSASTAAMDKAAAAAGATTASMPRVPSLNGAYKAVSQRLHHHSAHAQEQGPDGASAANRRPVLRPEMSSSTLDNHTARTVTSSNSLSLSPTKSHGVLFSAHSAGGAAGALSSSDDALIATESDSGRDTRDAQQQQQKSRRRSADVADDTEVDGQAVDDVDYDSDDSDVPFELRAKTSSRLQLVQQAMHEALSRHSLVHSHHSSNGSPSRTSGPDSARSPREDFFKAGGRPGSASSSSLPTNAATATGGAALTRADLEASASFSGGGAYTLPAGSTAQSTRLRGAGAAPSPLRSNTGAASPATTPYTSSVARSKLASASLSFEEHEDELGHGFQPSRGSFSRAAAANGTAARTTSPSLAISAGPGGAYTDGMASLGYSGEMQVFSPLGMGHEMMLVEALADALSGSGDDDEEAQQ